MVRQKYNMRTKFKISNGILRLVLMFVLTQGMISVTSFTAFAADDLTDNTTGSILKDTDTDGFYEISTVDELKAFANLVNGGSNSINAELTADIDLESCDWNPIGTYSDSDKSANAAYAGTFEGNYHVIKNLSVTVETAHETGLFGRISGGTLKNLGVVNATIENTQSIRAGVIAGEIHNSTVMNVYTAGTITVTTANANGQAGGIAGECAGSTLTNCYTTYGYLTGNAGTVNNCYYKADEVNSTSKGTNLPENAFTSGELAWVLNGSTAEGMWKQSLGTDTYPGFTGGTVYDTCGTSEGNSYSNDEPTHSYSSGICSVCGAFEPAKHVDSVYEISNVGQYMWFAEFVNIGNTTTNAKLMGNIDMTNYQSSHGNVMLGTSAAKYSGTFDGDGNTLTVNLKNTEEGYTAPFRYINGATIQNLTVDGTISTDQKFAAGLVSYNEGSSKIEKCMVSVTINSEVSGDGTHGGLVANVNSGSITINNCGFIGSITGGNTTSCGGFVGWAYGKTSISNSYIAGTFSTETSECYTFGRNPGNITISNSYYMTAYGTNNKGATQKSAAQFESGIVAGLLGEAFGQNVDNGSTKQNYPVLGGAKVYLSNPCSAKFSNTKITEAVAHSDSIICTVCGVYTGEENQYVERTWDKTAGVVNSEIKTVESYTLVTESTTTWKNGWYIVTGDVTISNRITATGTVNLILAYDATLTASKGISVNAGNTLNIYGQSGESGQLKATSSSVYAAIGGDSSYNAGNISIFGGTVTATVASSGAAIGGGVSGSGGTITIYGGTVTATASGSHQAGAGIGGGGSSTIGTSGHSGVITIYGGTVTAKGGTHAAGIGGGFKGNGEKISIYGGTVTATGGGMGAGIGGGSNRDNTGDTYNGGNGGTIVIAGGNVKATAGSYAEAIGKGRMATSSGTLKDANGNTLYLNTITLCGLTSASDITSIKGVDNYSLTDVSSLDTKMLYFYLPSSANLTSVVAGETEYIGGLTGTTTKSGTFHNYTYTKQGEIIKAICGGCSSSEATIAIAPPESTTYTGEPIEAKVTVDPANGISPAVSYEALTGNLTDGKPVNVGKYTATITLGDASISTTYEITKKTPEFSDFTFEAPENSSYDGTEKPANLTANHTGMGEITVSYFKIVEEEKVAVDGVPTDVGTYKIEVSVAEGDNYSAATKLTSDEWSFDITKADFVANDFTFEAPEDCTYDGDGKEANVTLPTEYTGIGDITVFYYGIVDEEETAVDGKPKDVGTYKVKINIAEGANNNAIQELTDDTWTFMIGQATPRIQNISGERDHATDKQIYNTTELDDINFSGTVIGVRDEEITGTFEFADSVTLLEAGTNDYAVIFKPDNANYGEATGSVSLTVMQNEVESITITQKPSKLSYVYGDTFEITGAVIQAAYTDGTTATVTDAVKWADTILGKEQEEIELTYEYEGKTVTAALNGIRVSYLDAPAEILYNGTSENEWYGNADGNVVVSAKGYAVSDTLNGNYAESYTLTYTKDGICEKFLYFKNDAGQMTDGVVVNVQYDHTAPTFPEDGGINIKENWWKSLLNSINFGLAFNDVTVDVSVKAEDAGSGIAAYYYYVDKTGSDTVLTAEQLSEKTFDSTTNSTIDSISAESKYVYYVYVVDNIGNKSNYICSNGVVIDRTAPSDISVKVTPADEAADIGITATEDGSGEDKYYLVYSTSDLSGVTKDNITTYADVSINTTGNFSISGLSPATTYNYVVAVTDKAGNVSEASDGKFTTKKMIPTFSIADIPAISGTYGQTLSEMTLSEGAATSQNGIAGTWSITETDKDTIYPTVNTESGYKITFMPDNTNLYETYVATVVPDVNPREVSVQSVTATDRNYEAGNVSVSIQITLADVLRAGDDVSLANANNLKGTLSSANAGTYTSVTLPELSLTGDDAGNYTLVQPTEAVATSVTINKLNPTIKVGTEKYNKTFGEAKFALDVDDTNTDADVTYLSSNEDVVTVSNGTVIIKGVGTAVITVSLAESTNYNAAESKTITVDVGKGSHTVEEINKSYCYLYDYDESIDLTELLPENCGTVTYGTPTVSADNSVTLGSQPSVVDGKLTYTVNKLSAYEGDKTGTITVNVSTDNYKDFTITVNVKQIEQYPVSLQDGSSVTLKNSTITYGEALSKLIFNTAVFVGTDGKEVAGTLAWKEPSATPNAGTTTATWVFTPNNREYKSLEGTVAITVNKVTPTVSAVPTVADRIYNPSVALQNSDLTGGTVSVAGRWSWQTANIVPVVNNNGYVAVFTPDDTTNYETVTKTITVNVAKATPHIETAPSAADITYGVPLGSSGLSGGVVQYSDTDNTQVAGSFAWKDENTKPAVSDSNSTIYTVVFTPADITNYNAVAFEVTINVAKAEAPEVDEISRSYFYFKEKTDTVDLAGLLPADCGTVEYGEPTVSGNDIYSSYLDVKEGVLSYTVARGTESNIGDAGSITIVAKTQNYEDITIKVNVTISDRLNVSLKKGTEVILKNNTLTYGETLSKLEFNSAAFVDDEGNTVAGTLTWKEPNATPNAGTTTATWVFTPDNEEYASLEGIANITVNKATPYIAVKPETATITYGDALSASALTDGVVQYSQQDETEVAGSFTWKEDTIKPAVKDSDSTAYTVLFTPEDETNYNQVETTVTLTVDKAQNAPNMPEKAMTVPYSNKKVSDITLPADWEWQETDKDTELPVGIAVSANSVYSGSDKGNYENETVTVAVTRQECDHTSGNREIRGDKAATCTEEGYNGDTYCKDCDGKIATGTTVAKLGHKYTNKVTKEPTATEKGVKTYTCTVCGDNYTEDIPALGNTSGGDTGNSGNESSGNGSGETTKDGYTSVEAEEEKVISADTDKGDVAGSSFYKLRLKATGKNKSIKLTWNKVKSADGYIIYGAKCGSSMKKLKTLKGNKKVAYTHKKLKKGKYYKYMVVAYKNIDGKKYTIAKSKSAHAVTNGGKYGNPTKVTVKSSKLTVKTGKKKTIKASYTLPKNKKAKIHIAKFRYESTNTKVATVTKKGVVKAKKKGTAYIYVYAQNGVYKKVKVTVK